MKVTSGSLCGLLVHEIGHDLGLPDRYRDPDCPLRPSSVLAGDYDIMNGRAMFFEPISRSHFEERDIDIIIGPLCDPHWQPK